MWTWDHKANLHGALQSTPSTEVCGMALRSHVILAAQLKIEPLCQLIPAFLSFFHSKLNEYCYLLTL